MLAQLVVVDDRVADRYVTNPETGCWEWQTQIDREGYGRLSGKLAHRVVYEILAGPIPHGLTLDHLCYVRNCVNPAHLEPVTRTENLRRAKARLTHCKRGHKFTPENTYVWRNARHCRSCNSLAVRRGRQERRLAVSL